MSSNEGDVLWSDSTVTLPLGAVGYARVCGVFTLIGINAYRFEFLGAPPFSGATLVKTMTAHRIGNTILCDVTGTPQVARTVTFTVKVIRASDNAVVSTSSRSLILGTPTVTPPILPEVTFYAAPTMMVGAQYQYLVGKVVQPSATASQAVWTLDSTHADYAKLPSGTSITTAGRLTIRPANTQNITVPVKIAIPHPTAGQPAWDLRGQRLLENISEGLPATSVVATPNGFPQARVGVAYSRTVGTITVPSSGGTWSLADRGTLPSGATLSSAGVLATTFTAAGPVTATVKASATGYLQALYPIEITVAAAPGAGEIVYSLNALANATVGVAYSATLGTVSAVNTFLAHDA